MTTRVRRIAITHDLKGTTSENLDDSRLYLGLLSIKCVHRDILIVHDEGRLTLLGFWQFVNPRSTSAIQKIVPSNNWTTDRKEIKVIRDLICRFDGDIIEYTTGMNDSDELLWLSDMDKRNIRNAKRREIRQKDR
jgi:hypothetical protein